MQRRDAILQSACDHFGRFGFRGASLRDIARDAGVSLTLLDHHFGCKSALLSAVVVTHATLLQDRAAALRRLRTAGVGGFTARDLVRAWIGVGFEVAQLPEGLRFLRLLARVFDVSSEDGVAREEDQRDGVTQGFIDALVDCYPGASYHAAASAWLCVNAALSALLTNDGRIERMGEVGQARPRAADQAWLERFLVAGIDAALGGPEPEADTGLREDPAESRYAALGSLAQADS